LPESSSNEVTALLAQWRDGDANALQNLVPLVYGELRRLAHHHLRAERSEHTLQSTALVHEAYLRLVSQELNSLQNRAHFFAVAAQLMRQILVDFARARGAAKRNSGATLSLDEAVAISPSKDVDLIALDDALRKLASLSTRQSRIVELRFFGGLSIEETSQVLGISAATVERDWYAARAWLHREIGGESRA
jgi:RNA polymerase sigma factor (TIGR02999 family)